MVNKDFHKIYASHRHITLPLTGENVAKYILSFSRKFSFLGDCFYPQLYVLCQRTTLLWPKCELICICL